MKWNHLIGLAFFLFAVSSMQAASYAPSNVQDSPLVQPKAIQQPPAKGPDADALSYVALGLSLAGIILFWVPVVSLLGLLLALGGLGLGIFLRKKVKRRWANQLAISLGMLTVISLIGIWGLVLLF